MIRLFPKPAGCATAVAAISNVSVAVELLNRLQHATGSQVTAFELMQRESLDLVTKHIVDTMNPLPDWRGWTVLIEVSNPAAFDATDALQEALAQAMDQGLVADAVFAKTERDRAALWRLRETLPEAHRLDGATIANDISVPLSAIAEFLAATDVAIRAALPTARSFAFGHVCAGNMHYSHMSPRTDAVLL